MRLFGAAFVNQLIWITLAIQILGWGNKEYLLRAFSKNPSKIDQLWQENLFSRAMGFLIIAPLFLFFKLPFITYFHLLVWLAGAFLSQSLEVFIIYQRKFWLAIWTEVVGFGLTAVWIWNKRENLDIETIIAAYAWGQSAKAALITYFLGQNFPLFHRFKTKFRKSHILRAIPFMLLGLSGMLNSRIDLYMVNGFLDDIEVGKYQVMTSLFIYVQASGRIDYPTICQKYLPPY